MNRILLVACLVVAAPAFAQLTLKKGALNVAIDRSGIKVLEDGDVLKIAGAGGTRAYACKPGQDVDIAGAGHHLTLTGECGEVGVAGSSNRVDVEAAAMITVRGTSNTVTWKRRVAKKEPRVTVEGLGNKVTSRGESRGE